MKLPNKRTGFGERSNGLQPLEMATKELIFKSGKKTLAKRVVVKFNQIENQTTIHPLNIRNQNNLTPASLRDILPSIQQGGVHTEGFAIEKNGKYSILESSRRRMACMLSKQDLPLYVFNADQISDEDLKEFIASTFTQKKLSYRELGYNYPTLMKQNNWSARELADHLNLGRETIRKHLVAANINQNIIDIFPDPEGIPNSFYSKLAKVEKYLNENNVNISNFVAQLNLSEINNADIYEMQLLIMKMMLKSIEVNINKQKWLTNDIRKFSEKNKYAKIHKSEDMKKITIELSELDADLYTDLIRYLKNKINL